MFANENSLFPTQDVSEKSFDQISAQDFHCLLNKIFNGREIFEPEHLNELVEPDIYPVFDFGFLGIPRAGLIATTQKNSYESTSHQFNYSRNPMTKIVVDPPVLQNCAKNIFNSATTLTSVGKNIISCANSAPSYEGQFEPKVRAIAAGADWQASQLSGRLNNLVGRLGTKAQQFLDADNSSAGSLTYSINSSVLSTALVALYPSLGILPFSGILGKLFPEGINLWNAVFGNVIVSDSPIAPETYSAMTTVNLNLRSGAGLESSVISTLVKGTSLVVLGNEITNGGYTWVKVQTENGGVGWVAKQYISETSFGIKKDLSKSETTKENSSTENNNTDSSPVPVPLNSIERKEGESCAEYAQRRRPSLGSTGAEDHGAYNYKYRTGVFQITNTDVDLTKKIAEGYAIIWDRGDPELGTDGYNLGHVAIVESVEKDKIIVSQANWKGEETMTISLDQLQSPYLYILP